MAAADVLETTFNRSSLQSLTFQARYLVRATNYSGLREGRYVGPRVAGFF